MGGATCCKTTDVRKVRSVAKAFIIDVEKISIDADFMKVRTFHRNRFWVDKTFREVKNLSRQRVL